MGNGEPAIGDAPELGEQPGKDQWRARLTAGRRERSADDRAAGRRLNGQHLVALISGPIGGPVGGPVGAPVGGPVGGPSSPVVVCGYLPLPTEPLDQELLDELTAAGSSVLVPLTQAGQPLDWCRYPCPTVPGPFGIQAPAGPRLGPAALLTADVILVPALAVDRRGVRLGRGGGHYDRSLGLLGRTPSRSRQPLRVAVLYDGEYVEQLPSEAHDRAVDAVVTPMTGVQWTGLQWTGAGTND